MKVKYSKNLLLFFFVSSAFIVSAQKDNYWSWTFNTTSTLLGGAVVAGSAGPSSIFYNPASISLEDVPSLSVSANLVSLKFLSVENLAGNGLDANQFKFKVQPRFISYNLPSNNKKIAWEFAILSPVSEEKELILVHQQDLDIIKRSEGVETYNGYLRYRYQFDEWLIGAGMSYTLGDRINIGASTFLSVQTMKYQFEQSATASQINDTIIVSGIPEPRYIAENTFNEDLKYWDLSLVLKLGLQYHSLNDRIKIGLNFTLPNLPLYGEADLSKKYLRSNVFDNSNSSFTENVVYNNLDEKVRTEVKTPMSISLGFQYTTSGNKNSILLTGEYFSSIDPYSILRRSNTGSKELDWISGRLEPMNFYHSAAEVVNLAIGYKQYINESIFLLGGFRTDFSSAAQDDIRFVNGQFKINQIHLNKYHTSLGPVFRIKNMIIITGIQYTYGQNKEFTNIVNYADPVEYIPVTNQSLQGIREDNSTAILHDISLFFGLSFDF